VVRQGWRDGNFAPLAGCQAIEMERADRHPYQAQGRKPDSGGHAPDLTIAAFANDKLDPGCGDIPTKANRRIPFPQLRFGQQTNLSRPGLAVAKLYATTQLLQCCGIGPAFHLYPVGLGQLVPRVSNTFLQGSDVGQQQQALAVVVEAPGRSHLRQSDGVCQCPSARIIRELRKHPEWFVEGNQHFRSSVSSCE